MLAAGVGVAAIPSRAEPNEPRIRALRAVADAYVTSADEKSNFGLVRELRVNSAPVAHAFLRFDARYLEKGSVLGVNLLVFSRSRSEPGFQVRLVRGRWRERKITYANAPRLSSRFVASGPLRRKAWKAIDITALVEGQDKHVSLALTTVARGAVELGSRESGLTGPRLVVELAVEDETGTDITPTVPAP